MTIGFSAALVLLVVSFVQARADALLASNLTLPHTVQPSDSFIPKVPQDALGSPPVQEFDLSQNLEKLPDGVDYIISYSDRQGVVREIRSKDGDLRGVAGDELGVRGPVTLTIIITPEQ